MPIKSSELRHVVNIEQRSESQDSVTGEIATSWSVLHRDVRASIEPLSVKDFIQSGASQSDVNTRIKIRYLSGLNKSMRIIATCDCHIGRIYSPKEFLEDNETGQTYLTIPCSYGVNQGDD